HRRHRRVLVPHEHVEVHDHQRAEHQHHPHAVATRWSTAASPGGTEIRPFLARRRSPADHGSGRPAISRVSRRTKKMATNPASDLPPREQLELFSQSGQGAGGPAHLRTETVMAKKSKSTKGSGGGGGGSLPPGGDGATPGDHDASLEVEARRRYLNYAMSVIT